MSMKLLSAVAIFALLVALALLWQLTGKEGRFGIQYGFDALFQLVQYRKFPGIYGIAAIVYAPLCITTLFCILFDKWARPLAFGTAAIAVLAVMPVLQSGTASIAYGTWIVLAAVVLLIVSVIVPEAESQPKHAPNIMPDTREIEGYEVSFPAGGGIQMKLTSSALAFSVCLKLVLLTMLWGILRLIDPLAKNDPLMYGIAALLSIGIAIAVLPPIRLGFRISEGQLVVRSLLFIRIREIKVALADLREFGLQIESSTRGIARVAHFFFRTEGQRIKTLRMTAHSAKGIRDCAWRVINVVKPFLPPRVLIPGLSPEDNEIRRTPKKKSNKT